MSGNQTAFEKLKKDIISKSESKIVIDKVKECFSAVIDSRRSLSRVKNLNSLFSLLQERDILNCDNVCALEHFAILLQDKDIQSLVQGYKKLYIDYEYCICGEELSNITFPVINPERSLENRKLDDLHSAFINIAMNIGKNWRDLASELAVPELYVDQVREKYPNDFNQQALSILEIWKEHYQEAATIEVLKAALEARLCKRKGIGLHMLKPVIIV